MNRFFRDLRARASLSLAFVPILLGCSLNSTASRTSSPAGGASDSIRNPTTLLNALPQTSQASSLPTFAAAATASQSTVYVSTTGNDANSGTIEAPLRTLGQAGSLAEQYYSLRSAQTAPAQGFTIVMREGWYFMDSPLVLTPEHSGFPGAPLTITSYPGEYGRLYGAFPVYAAGVSPDQGSWSDQIIPTVSGPRTVKVFTFQGAARAQLQGYISRIKSTANAGKFAITEMFMNGERKTRARHPNVYVPVNTPTKNCSTGSWGRASDPDLGFSLAAMGPLYGIFVDDNQFIAAQP